jgi:hypothetical protein
MAETATLTPAQESAAVALAEHLRERIAYHEGLGHKDLFALAATVTAPKWPAGTGIRPELLSVTDRGKIFGLSLGQCRRFLAYIERALGEDDAE